MKGAAVSDEDFDSVKRNRMCSYNGRSHFCAEFEFYPSVCVSRCKKKKRCWGAGVNLLST